MNHFQILYGKVCFLLTTFTVKNLILEFRFQYFIKSKYIMTIYYYFITEAMADAGVKMGLPRDLAYQLAAQTMVIGFEKTSKY